MSGTHERDDWRGRLGTVIEDWLASDRAIVTSPDVDGIASAAILGEAYGARVVGFYTTTHLLLLDGTTRQEAADALWLDHDISEPGVRCVGQHLVLHRESNLLPRRHPLSFNPNHHFGQDYFSSFRGASGRSRDKYPFGTVHLIADLVGGLDAPPGSESLAILAHADGSWSTPIDYPVNCRIWADTMFGGDPVIGLLVGDYVGSPGTWQAHRDLVDALVEEGAVRRNTSRRRGLEGLLEEWRDFTGRQAVNGQVRNPGAYLYRFRRTADLISRGLDCFVPVGRTVTSVVSGDVQTPYPDRIGDFDQLMMDEAIFSHAFTDRRTLRYTKGISLSDDVAS